MSYKVKYVFISSLTFNNRLSHKLLIEVNEMMQGLLGYVQLTINNYEIRARRDRDNKHGGGLIEFVRKGLQKTQKI